MTTPSTSELTLLRSQPHNTKLWMSIYQPTIIFSCQITGSYDKGDRTFIYSNASGSYANVQSGMVMFVGSSYANTDKGKIRVKSATSSTITAAENSHIDWLNGDYLTVMNFFEIFPVFPRIIQDPADPLKTIWYKDFDIAYTNQNSVLGTFINMGSHVATFLENGQSAIFFSASGTSNLLGSALSYEWIFEGALSGTSNVHTPGYIYWNTPGHYTVSLRVYTESGEDKSYRHISIYDRPENGTNVPILNWQITKFSGSRDQGGYTTSIRIDQSITDTQLKDGSLVVLFSDDRYGTTDGSLGGNGINRSKIVFVGYVLSGTIRYNWRDSYVEFDVGSPSEIMKRSEGFSVSVQDNSDPDNADDDPDWPSNWMALLDMDMKRAIYHYLRWHSTVLNCCDFEYKGRNPRIQYFDVDRSSLYDGIHTLMSGAVLGKVVCDRQGKIWSETDIYTEPQNYNIGMSLDKRDWMQEPILDERMSDDISFIEAGGIAYDGTDSLALLSIAPGSTPGNRGTVDRFQGLALDSQAQLNEIIANLYAFRNSRYPNLELEIAGNYRNFDIAPQEKLLISLAPADTARGITFVNKPFYINGLSMMYDPRTEFMSPSLSLSEVVSGTVSETLSIPIEPPTTGDGGGFNIPPISIPPIGGIIIPSTIGTISAASYFGYNLAPASTPSYSTFADSAITGSNIGNWILGFNTITPYTFPVMASGRYLVTVSCRAFAIGVFDLGAVASLNSGYLGVRYGYGINSNFIPAGLYSNGVALVSTEVSWGAFHPGPFTIEIPVILYQTLTINYGGIGAGASLNIIRISS